MTAPPSRWPGRRNTTAAASTCPRPHASPVAASTPPLRGPCSLPACRYFPTYWSCLWIATRPGRQRCSTSPALHVAAPSSASSQPLHSHLVGVPSALSVDGGLRE